MGKKDLKNARIRSGLIQVEDITRKQEEREKKIEDLGMRKNKIKNIMASDLTKDMALDVADNQRIHASIPKNQGYMIILS